MFKRNMDLLMGADCFCAGMPLALPRSLAQGACRTLGSCILLLYQFA